jgi:hypothetical protein
MTCGEEDTSSTEELASTSIQLTPSRDKTISPGIDAAGDTVSSPCRGNACHVSPKP